MVSLVISRDDLLEGLDELVVVVLGGHDTVLNLVVERVLEVDLVAWNIVNIRTKNTFIVTK